MGMSGGVDSSVAAYLLLQQGFHVEAIFMKNWEEDDREDFCSAGEDLADAQAVCDQLNIKLRTVNFSTEYWDRVFKHFLNEYRAGRTPNPDVLCNKEIKFRAFLDYALSLGADCIATGHYARIMGTGKKLKLIKGRDINKDQSYFLYLLSNEQLAQALFPIGEMEKSEVRKIAVELALPVASKKDSTGICFIGERPFADFLKTYIDEKPGKIITVDGKIIGDHNGLTFFTHGQRQGLGIGGGQGDSNQPWYVVKKDLEKNQLIVAQGKDHPALFSDILYANQLHWISGASPAFDSAEKDAGLQAFTCTAKTRYRQPDQQCTVEPDKNGGVWVTFSQPQRAVTPGQSLVFYREDECIGGGIIT